jgi:hypothetical protein
VEDVDRVAVVVRAAAADKVADEDRAVDEDKVEDEDKVVDEDRADGFWGRAANACAHHAEPLLPTRRVFPVTK